MDLDNYIGKGLIDITVPFASLGIVTEFSKGSDNGDSVKVWDLNRSKSGLFGDVKVSLSPHAIYNFAGSLEGMTPEDLAEALSLFHAMAQAYERLAGRGLFEIQMTEAREYPL